MLSVAREQARAFPALRYPRRPYPGTTWERTISENYGQIAFDLAFTLQSRNDPGDRQAIARTYRGAIGLAAPAVPAAYKNLGVLLNSTGGNRRELISLWRRYLELEPDDPQAGAFRAAVDRLESSS